MGKYGSMTAAPANATKANMEAVRRTKVMAALQKVDDGAPHNYSAATISRLRAEATNKGWAKSKKSWSNDTPGMN